MRVYLGGGRLLRVAQRKKDTLYDTMGKTLGQLIGWNGTANDRTCLAVNSLTPGGG